MLSSSDALSSFGTAPLDNCTTEIRIALHCGISGRLRYVGAVLGS
jgi:hypothetical protein